MDAFSEVFRRETRLSVVLYRDGWGTTPWTGFEETAIQSRALETRFTSLLIVRLDRSELPTWIPTQILYVSEESETRQEMAAVIRARARERGAVVRKLTAAEIAIQKSKEQSQQAERDERARSAKAPAEIEHELARLYAHIMRIAAEIKQSDASIDIAAGTHGDTCVISSAQHSVALTLMKYGNTLRDRALRVNQWKGRHVLPSPSNPNPGGYLHEGATHYKPVVAPNNEWAWKWEPNFDGDSSVFILSLADDVHQSEELAEQIIKEYVERIFG
jgi:hypothetical protein